MWSRRNCVFLGFHFLCILVICVLSKKTLTYICLDLSFCCNSSCLSFALSIQTEQSREKMNENRMYISIVTLPLYTLRKSFDISQGLVPQFGDVLLHTVCNNIIRGPRMLLALPHSAHVPLLRSKNVCLPPCNAANAIFHPSAMDRLGVSIGSVRMARDLVIAIDGLFPNQAIGCIGHPVIGGLSCAPPIG